MDDVPLEPHDVSVPAESDRRRPNELDLRGLQVDRLRFDPVDADRRAPAEQAPRAEADRLRADAPDPAPALQPTVHDPGVHRPADRDVAAAVDGGRLDRATDLELSDGREMVADDHVLGYAHGAVDLELPGLQARVEHGQAREAELFEDAHRSGHLQHLPAREAGGGESAAHGEGVVDGPELDLEVAEHLGRSAGRVLAGAKTLMPGHPHILEGWNGRCGDRWSRGRGRGRGRSGRGGWDGGGNGRGRRRQGPGPPQLPVAGPAGGTRRRRCSTMMHRSW